MSMLPMYLKKKFILTRIEHSRHHSWHDHDEEREDLDDTFHEGGSLGVRQALSCQRPLYYNLQYNESRNLPPLCKTLTIARKRSCGKVMFS